MSGGRPHGRFIDSRRSHSPEIKAARLKLWLKISRPKVEHRRGPMDILGRCPKGVKSLPNRQNRRESCA